jgi:hypothetical protein
MAPDSSSDLLPEGRTLWEMFLDWMRGRHQNGTHPDDYPSNYPNPLEWEPGVPAPLSAIHGPEFADSLAIVETVRHVVRKLGGQKFNFIDYHLRITPRQGDVSYARVRCLPKSEAMDSDWDKLLLRSHDEFAYDKDFESLLEDPTGIFNIEDDPSGVPAQFVRLNQLQMAWSASACEHHQATEDAAAKREPFKDFRYWDYSRPAAGGEEFLFIEIDGQSGWTELWRGSAFEL